MSFLRIPTHQLFFTFICMYTFSLSSAGVLSLLDEPEPQLKVLSHFDEEYSKHTFIKV